MHDSCEELADDGIDQASVEKTRCNGTRVHSEAQSSNAVRGWFVDMFEKSPQDVGIGIVTFYRRDVVVGDVEDILAVPLLGVIPESEAVLKASNSGAPVILDNDSAAGQAYGDAIARLLGEDVPHRFLEVQKKSFLKRLMGA